jgi:hypothetical protein
MNNHLSPPDQSAAPTTDRRHEHARFLRGRSETTSATSGVSPLFWGARPDTATAEDLDRFQVEQREAGVPVPTMSTIVSALRFFFTHTLDRPDLARRPVRQCNRIFRPRIECPHDHRRADE